MTVDTELLRRPATRAEFASFFGRATLDGFRYRRAFRDVERFFFLLGYARSGSTLFGSVLNAHPEMVIAHEADAFRYLRPGVTRNQLYAILLDRDRRFEIVGRHHHGFDYAVPGYGQGHFSRLRVIGDKHAGQATKRLGEDPRLLTRLRGLVGVPIRSVHLVRNPFDNIASNATNRRLPVSQCIEIYRQRGTAVDKVRVDFAPDELLDLRYEDFVADPSRWLRTVCRFVGVDAPDPYIGACAAVMDADGRKSRYRVEWSAEERHEVEALIASRPVLQGYTFDE